MELEKLHCYLNQELAQAEKDGKETEDILQKQLYQIEEIGNKIHKIENEYDFAYDVFSPVSQEYDKMKAQVGELRKEQDRLGEEQKRLQEKLEYLKNKKVRTCEVIEELEAAENTQKEQLKRLKEKYSRSLGIKMIENQEKERQRIARELHDTTVQNLTAMIYKMEFCQQVMDSDPIRARLEMQLVINAIRESVDDMREVIYNLRPMSFDDIGFKETLQCAVDRLRKSTEMQIEFTVRGEVSPMSPAYELTILRIIQEATNNSKKYAESEKIEIVLSYEENQIVLSICDKGNGFDMGERKTGLQNSGFGISMMKERVCLLKGQIMIHSEKDEGTQIIVVLPKKKLEETNEDQNIIS